jgi:hypothetical protein
MNKKFEYLAEDTWAPPQQYWLDKMGHKGWELVTILREKHNGGVIYTSYFKREKADD